MRHEIERNVEEDRSKNLVRQVADHGGDCFGKGVVKRIFGLLLHNGSLSVQCENLRNL